MNVMVTGAGGFLGRHLVIGLKEKGHEVYPVTRTSSLSEKEQYLVKSDFVFHFAGVNRPERVEDFEVGNFDSLKEICELLSKSGRQIPIALSSSTQAEFENPYGRSKRKAEEYLTEFAKNHQIMGHIYRFPNLFGKWVRPNYNSAIATFCYKISREEDYVVNDRSTIVSLNYIDDVVSSLISLLDYEFETGRILKHQVEPEYKKTLGEIVDLIHSFKDGRNRQFIPDVADSFTKKLYSTYLTYVDFSHIPVSANMKFDDRGWLFELIKSNHGGQVFVSTTKPGITRGNHYHHTKTERFCLIKGEGLIQFRHLEKSQIIDVRVDDKEIKIVDIPPGYTHSIKNIGSDDMIVLFWANEIFDPEHPDTTMLKVIQ